MERLTRRMCGGWGVMPGYELNTARGMKAVVDRLAACEETGLTPEDIANWIYSSINPPDSEFEKTIRAVENALGFKLFVWQKTYIENEQFRKMGETTARVLRDLLDVSEKPIDYTRGAATPRQQFYRKEIREIKAKLDAAGIPTRTVFFSEKDKRAYMHKKRTGGIDRGI